MRRSRKLPGRIFLHWSISAVRTSASRIKNRPSRKAHGFNTILISLSWRRCSRFMDVFVTFVKCDEFTFHDLYVYLLNDTKLLFPRVFAGWHVANISNFSYFGQLLIVFAEDSTSILLDKFSRHSTWASSSDYVGFKLWLRRLRRYSTEIEDVWFCLPPAEQKSSNCLLEMK